MCNELDSVMSLVDSAEMCISLHSDGRRKSMIYDAQCESVYCDSDTMNAHRVECGRVNDGLWTRVG